MPNWMQRKGMQTPPERPDRVKPVPEKIEGIYYPYRGTENHGVKQPNPEAVDDYYESEHWDDGDVPRVLEPEPEPEPVPVRVVQETARERLSWRSIQVPVTDVKSQVVGRHEKRRNLIIRNPSTSSDVFIAEDQSVSTYTGYLLEQGQEITLRTTEEVYAVCAPGENTVLHIAYEYAVEL